MLAKPSLALAGLALGLHHSGVMGRVLMDDIRSSGTGSAQTLKSCGASPRISWLYGPLADVSRPYLTYAIYRIDVILRDTAIIGLVGGAGLGWQLMEALSSFHWWLVFWIVLTSAVLTLLGESLGERLQRSWNSRAMAL
jgi:phosphonate transport system permease protein